MKILKTNKNIIKILQLVGQAGFDNETFLNRLEKWDDDTKYFLENGRIKKEKYKEAMGSENKDRWLLNRDLITYIDDIVKGWMAEELVEMIIEQSCPYIRTAQDHKRELIFNNDMFKVITGGLDGEIQFNHKFKVVVDIMSDFTGYCQRNNSISLGFEKYDKMIKQTAILFILDIKNGKIGVVNPSKHKIEEVEIENIDKGYKKEMKLDYDKEFYPIEDFNNFIIFYNILTNTIKPE